MPGRISPYLVQRRLARVMLNAQNNMAAKNNSKETRGRKWREVELKVFATVLADDRNEFTLTLETLALFIFFKILRKNSMLVCRRRTYQTPFTFKQTENIQNNLLSFQIHRFPLFVTISKRLYHIISRIPLRTLMIKTAQLQRCIIFQIAGLPFLA